MSHSRAVMTSQKSDMHYTPIEVLELVHEFWPQGIDLDPASDEVANQLVKAKRIYTEADNGLSHVWQADRLFFNPPYSLTEEFMRAFCSCRVGISEAISLTKTDHSTNWYKRIWQEADAICQIDYRLSFHKGAIAADQLSLIDEPDPITGKQSGAPFCSTLAYYGPYWHRFAEMACRLGPVIPVNAVYFPKGYRIVW